MRGDGRPGRARPRLQRLHRQRIRIAELAAKLAGAARVPSSSPRSPASSAPAISATASPTPSLARELLGFEAKVPIEDGLPELVEWVAAQSVAEKGDEALAGLRARGLVA